MKVQNNMVSVASHLVAALCSDLIIDIVKVVTGLSDAASMVTHAVDATTVAQAVAGLI